jgi:hypothetical protein
MVLIALPGSPRSQDAGRSKPISAPTAPSSARGVVLVVEGQADVRAQIVEVLANMGCEVIGAVDGLEGSRCQSASKTDPGLSFFHAETHAPHQRADSFGFSGH